AGGDRHGVSDDVQPERRGGDEGDLMRTRPDQASRLGPGGGGVVTVVGGVRIDRHQVQEPPDALHRPRRGDRQPGRVQLHPLGRAGRRAALALGGLVTAAGNLLCAYAPDYATFVGARFVAGAGAAFVLTAGQIVLADITTPAVRGRAMAIYQGTFLLAVGIGPFPGGLLAEKVGLHAPCVAQAVAGG